MVILISLGLFFLCQIFLKPEIKLKFSKAAFYLSIISVLGYLVYLGFHQYNEWKLNEITLRLLPPYTSIFYLINYIFIRFGLYYLASLFISLIFFFSAYYFNKKRGFLFFEIDEIYFATTTLFLLGNPVWYYAWIWYFVALISTYLAWHLLLIFKIQNSKFKISENRLPLYYLWLPTGILVILIKIMSNF